MSSGVLLITGANGFLGASCVARCALHTDQKVVAIWHSGNDRLIKRLSNNVCYVQCDLTNRNEVESLFSTYSIDSVIHAAALLPDNRPNYITIAVNANVLATVNLVECSVKNDVENFVYCSTMSIYGSLPCGKNGWEEGGKVEPGCEYSLTKYFGEQCLEFYCNATGMKGVSLRLSGIHGPGRNSGVVYSMLDTAMKDMVINVKNRDNRFQLLFIDDAVDAVFAATNISASFPYQCINVASHVVPDLESLAAEIKQVSGSKSVIEYGVSGNKCELIMNTEKMNNLLLHSPTIKEHLQQMHDYLNKA